MISDAKIRTGENSTVSEEFAQARATLHRQMLSAISHDLKTPLATIIGSLEVHRRMGDRLTREKRDILLNSALGEAYRLDNFITNILDMARLEGSMVTPRPERCNIASLINDCIVRLGPKRHRCEITLMPIGDLLHAQIDPMLLGRAIGLLLENAMKHGGKTPVIEVEYGSDGPMFFIRIRDYGPGIPPGKEETIFSKYTRFAHSDRQNAGTGLGLAICRQLMHLLDGTVATENHPEGGALFTLSFPADALQ